RVAERDRARSHHLERLNVNSFPSGSAAGAGGGRNRNARHRLSRKGPSGAGLGGRAAHTPGRPARTHSPCTTRHHPGLGRAHGRRVALGHEAIYVVQEDAEAGYISSGMIPPPTLRRPLLGRTRERGKPTMITRIGNAADLASLLSGSPPGPYRRRRAN